MTNYTNEEMLQMCEDMALQLGAEGNYEEANEFYEIGESYK